jgi:hypothetical protein
MRSSRHVPRIAPIALALGLVVAGCGVTAGPSPSPTSFWIDHPPGAREIVLRYDSGGGHAPWELFLSMPPVFTLYGDGTVVYRNPAADQPLAEGSIIRNVPLQTFKLTEEQVQGLLAFALADSGLGIARARYDYPALADGPWSVFTVRAGGLDKTVEVYGLGIEGPDVPDPQIRKAMARLAERLTGWDLLSSIQVIAYVPERYRAVLTEDPAIPQGGPRSWPWSTIAPSDFVLDPNGLQVPNRVLTAAEVAETGLSNLEGGAWGISLASPGGGGAYRLTLRPLLPDEDR